MHDSQSERAVQDQTACGVYDAQPAKLCALLLLVVHPLGGDCSVRADFTVAYGRRILSSRKGA